MGFMKLISHLVQYFHSIQTYPALFGDLKNQIQIIFRNIKAEIQLKKMLEFKVNDLIIASSYLLRFYNQEVKRGITNIYMILYPTSTFEHIRK